MLARRPTLFFDFVDPGSYLASCVVDAEGLETTLDWRGFEIRPHPEPPVDAEDEAWRRHQSRLSAYAEALDVPMRVPARTPWTRKAHELAELARTKDCHAGVRRAIFRAHFVESRDIGRIDHLVEIARDEGLDATEAKAALDVDAYAYAVASARAEAGEREVAGVPALVAHDRRLEGLRSPGEIAQWIRDATAAQADGGCRLPTPGARACGSSRTQPKTD